MTFSVSVNNIHRHKNNTFLYLKPRNGPRCRYREPIKCSVKKIRTFEQSQYVSGPPCSNTICSIHIDIGPSGNIKAQSIRSTQIFVNVRRPQCSSFVALSSFLAKHRFCLDKPRTESWPTLISKKPLKHVVYFRQNLTHPPFCLQLMVKTTRENGNILSSLDEVQIGQVRVMQTCTFLQDSQQCRFVVITFTRLAKDDNPSGRLCAIIRRKTLCLPEALHLVQKNFFLQSIVRICQNSGSRIGLVEYPYRCTKM